MPIILFRPVRDLCNYAELWVSIYRTFECVTQVVVLAPNCRDVLGIRYSFRTVLSLRILDELDPRL